MQSGPSHLTVTHSPLINRARVVVAAPFPIILVGICKIIEDDPRLEVVKEVSTLHSLLDTVIAETPEVALVDWSLTLQDPAATLILRRPEFQTTAVVFLTSSGEAQERRAMMQLGARDVVSKRASAIDVQSALWKAVLGSKRREATAADKGVAIKGRADATNPEQRIQQLTRRERQLIPLVCGGMRNKAIAEYLGIAESTVWHHLTSVFTKLQVDDRMGLAAFAYRYGLVMPSPQSGSSVQMGAD